MKKSILIFVAIINLLGFNSFAQTGSDTIIIDAHAVNTNVLKPSTNRYLVYFKMENDSARSNPQLWTRKIEYSTYQGRDAIVITQQWEGKDTIVHKVTSVCDRRTFEPLHHLVWWKRGTGEFDFINKSASLNNIPLTDADTAASRENAWSAFKMACNQYVLNWHLDLEVFPVLPYKKNTTFLIPFYDPGFSAPRNQAYTVIGTAVLTGYNNQKIDCWLLSHESKNNKEIFWISKKTREVLKLEQHFGKDNWRYKIKLGFSV